MKLINYKTQAYCGTVVDTGIKMATCDDFSDVQTDDISVPYFVNFGETVATSSNESKGNDLHNKVISGKRKLDSDTNSSSDSDETESVEHFKHLSVDEEKVTQNKTENNGVDVEESDATKFPEEDNICADKDGDSILHILTLFQETYQLLRWLCSCCDSKVKDLINKKNKLGQTAQHKAAHDKDSEIIESLLYVGADPGVQDARGRTCLHILADNGGAEILKTLCNIFVLKDLTLEYSGGLCNFTDIPNYDGFSALHLAIMNKDTNMVALLLSLGASTATGDRRSGRTALHFAGIFMLMSNTVWLLMIS